MGVKSEEWNISKFCGSVLIGVKDCRRLGIVSGRKNLRGVLWTVSIFRICRKIVVECLYRVSRDTPLKREQRYLELGLNKTVSTQESP